MRHPSQQEQRWELLGAMSHRPECSNGWILSECGVHANPSQVSDHANVSMSLLIIGQCDLSLYHHYTVHTGMAHRRISGPKLHPQLGALP